MPTPEEDLARLSEFFQKAIALDFPQFGAIALLGTNTTKNGGLMCFFMDSEAGLVYSAFFQNRQSSPVVQRVIVTPEGGNVNG